MKRFLSILLSVAMVMSMMPMAFAESVTDNGSVVAEKVFSEEVETVNEPVQKMAKEQDISSLAATIENTVDKTSAAVKVDGINNDWLDYYFANLSDAVDAINKYPSKSNTARIFILKDSMELSETLNIGNDSVNVQVQIFANVESTVKRADGFTGAFFNVAKGSTLTFGNKSQNNSCKNLTLDGNKAKVTASAPLIVSEGTLVFNRDITLQNNKNQNSYSFGGAIYIDDSGSFEMKDGIIQNNECAPTYLGGGGAIASDGGDIKISGGSIIENKITAVSGAEEDVCAGDSICFGGKNLTITGGTIQSSSSSKKDIFLQSTTDTDFDKETTTVYDSVLAISGSPIIGTVILECENLVAEKRDSENNVTWSQEYSTRPYIKVIGALGKDTTISVSGRYSDYKSDTWRSELISGIQLVKFADGLNASDYVSKFLYNGTAELYFDVDSEGGLSLTDTPVIRYSVTVKKPGITSSFPYCKITVSGSNLDSVEEGTKLSISHTDTSNATNNYLTFGKYIVTTESGKAVDVDSDNSFIMPNENVTVTAKYNPSPYFYVRSYGVKGTQNAQTEKYPNKDSETGGAWDGGAAEYKVYFLDAGDNRNGAGTVTLNQAGGLKARKYQPYATQCEAMSSIGNTITATFNIDESKYDVEKVSIVTYSGISIDSHYDASTKTATFTLPDIDYGNDAQVYLDVKLVQKPYTVTVKKNIESAGKVTYKIYDYSGSPVKTTAGYNDKVYLTVTKNGDYKIKNITVKNAAGNTISEDANLTYFTMPASDVTINVEFELDACAITTDIKNGTISGITSQAAIGSDVSFTLAPTDDTYKLDSYKVFKTGDEATTVDVTESNGTYTFTMPSYPVTVSAIFVKKTHAVTVEIQGETAGGAVSINKTSPVTVGEEVQVTVDTNAHYVLASLTMNGSPITDYKFTMPNKAVTITAVFEKTKHALHYVESQNGTIQEITASDALPWGTVLHFTVTPNPYYVIDYVAASINGVSTRIPPEAEGKYTYTTTPADTTIKAFYKKQQFTVKASATTNGTITLGEPATLDWDDNFTINVKADPNYEIDTVTVDGENVSVNNRGDYTFVMPKHDVTVSATFKKIKYTITGEGNNVTFGIPDKSTYNWGDTVKITVTPAEWYNIKNVYAKTGTTEITKVSGEENTYSFTMPASDITIVAVAERPNFTVTFDSQGGSAITPATVAKGAALTKPAAPSWAGRGFAGWYTDAECTEKYDFTTPVTGNITLYARWFLWGDVNSDGNVDSADALLIRRCAVGLTPYSNIKNNLAGFVTGLISDSKTAPDSGDALAIRRYAVGLINRYKIEDIAAGYEFDLENKTYIPKA